MLNFISKFLINFYLLSLLTFSQVTDSVKFYSLDEVTVVANRIKTKTSDLFTKVEILDIEKLKNTNGFSLSDKLKTSPLTFIKSYGNVSSLQTISINGLGSEHSLILIDGVKLNSYQNSTVDLSLIPIENIERIEIINNGLSSVYGSDAISGVINLITKSSYKSNYPLPFGFNGSVSYGSYNTFRYHFALSNQIKSISSKFYLTREKSDGDYDYYFHSGNQRIKKQRQNANHEFYDIGFISEYFFNDYNLIKINSSFINHFKRIPGIEIGTPPTDSDQRDRNWNNLISLENKISKKLTSNTSFNFQNNLMNYRLKPNVNSYYKNIVLSLSQNLTLVEEKFSSTVGYNYSFATLSSNQIESKALRELHAFYISGNLNPITQISLFPSIRYDFISDIEKNVLTFKFGVNIKPFDDNDLRLRSNIGNNFRAPTFNDLYWKEAGNKNLLPEKSVNKELGILYKFNYLFDISFDITYTHIKADNKIVWLPARNFIWKPVNIASSTSENFLITLSIQKKIDDKINLDFDIGYNMINSIKTSEDFTNDPTKGKQFPHLPKHSFKSNLSFKYDLITLNLFYSHNYKRFSDFENLKPVNPINLIDGNIIFDLNLFDIELKFKFEVNNLLNFDYQIISGYPMPLRNYKLTLLFNN
ncbi:MAG: TonB-dependent receptor plug domain-containing protein [Ignavibacterium sp.]|nr:TonB-dependent receptor plug domain-containing protein [Ignavibacterium sp.]MDW8374352.1 TonB-dependent receptor plug domain-containing protein [Ignavibacteriales bacterium]